MTDHHYDLIKKTIRIFLIVFFYVIRNRLITGQAHARVIRMGLSCCKSLMAFIHRGARCVA